jgi:CelD/BcsL family acetyltransferase involved in cellulose biosynthesis
VAAALRRAARTTGTSIARYEQFTRAAVGAHPEGPLRLSLSGERRRRLARLLRNLGRAEGAEARVLYHSSERSVMDAFLALEGAGWKGRAGTSMTARPGHADFFAEVCDGFDSTGRLRLDALEAGGRAAAVMCSFRAGPGLFLFKIAHDPALARYSPGTQVLADVVQASAPAWVDSGAAPDEVWLNDLLPERRELATLVVAPPGYAGRVVASATRSFVAARDARVRRR